MILKHGLDIREYFRTKFYKSFVCVVVFLLITTKTAPAYYKLLYSPLGTVLELGYQVLMLMGIVLVPLYVYALLRYRGNYRLWPFLAIIIIVLLKSIQYAILEGEWSAFLVDYIAYPNLKAVGIYAREMLNWFRVFGVVAMVYMAVEDKKDLNRMLATIAIAFVIPMTAATIKRPDMIGVRMITVGGVAFAGSFWNLAVRIFICVFWLWFCQLKDADKRDKIIFGIAIALVIFGGTVGISRTFIMGFAVSFAVYILFCIIYKQKLSMPVIIAAIVFIIVLPFMDFLVQSYQQRFEVIAEGTIANPRFVIWELYLSKINEYWLFGTQKGAWVRYAMELPRLWAPHCTPLSWLIYYGLPGLFVFCALLFGIGKSAVVLAKTGEKKIVPFIFAWLAAYISVAFINETGFTTLETYIGFAMVLATIKVYAGERLGGGKEEG